MNSSCCFACTWSFASPIKLPLSQLPSFLAFALPIPYCCGRKQVSSCMGLSSQPFTCYQEQVTPPKNLHSCREVLSSSGPLVYWPCTSHSWHPSFFLTARWVFPPRLIILGQFSASLNSHGSAPWKITSLSTSRKSHSCILHFMQTDYFGSGKYHLVLYQRSASSDIFQAPPAPITLQTKLIKRWSGISFLQEESSCSATDTTKQTGYWMRRYHSAQPAKHKGGRDSLLEQPGPWFQSCQTPHRTRCKLQIVVHR